MKTIKILALALAVSAAVMGSAQYGGGTQGDNRQHDDYTQHDQRFMRDTGSSNWGMREESSLIKQLGLHGDQANRVRQLQQRTAKRLSGQSRDRASVLDAGREFHLELARILDRDQDAHYSELWRDALRRHQNWLTWQFDVTKRTAQRLHLDQRQKDRFNDLTRETGHQIDDALGFRSDSGSSRNHFSEAIDSAATSYTRSVMDLLDDKQRSTLRDALRKAVTNRSSDERFRDEWVHSL